MLSRASGASAVGNEVKYVTLPPILYPKGGLQESGADQGKSFILNQAFQKYTDKDQLLKVFLFGPSLLDENYSKPGPTSGKSQKPCGPYEVVENLMISQSSLISPL